jgi:hypothetical protein
VIARYLDWRTATAGSSHPLAELRAQYGRGSAQSYAQKRC